MKKLLIVCTLLTGLIATSNAQEAGKFRLGIDFGYASPSDGGGGVLFDIEPKYNIADNMNVGFRIGGAALAKVLGEEEAKIGISASYLGTYDYYFNIGSSSFAPFLGAGIGYYALSSVEFDDVDAAVDLSGQFGGMIRGGFELGKFRLGLEYNIIPKSDVNNVNISGTSFPLTTVDEEIKNGYFGASIGFYLGGGKWGR